LLLAPSDTQMLAQALAEYGALQAMASSFSNAYNRIESMVGQGNLKYILLIALAVFVLLLVKKRPTY
jgi:hypothetical protein